MPIVRIKSNPHHHHDYRNTDRTNSCGAVLRGLKDIAICNQEIFMEKSFQDECERGSSTFADGLTAPRPQKASLSSTSLATLDWTERFLEATVDRTYFLAVYCRTSPSTGLSKFLHLWDLMWLCGEANRVLIVRIITGNVFKPSAVTITSTKLRFASSCTRTTI